MGPDFREVDGCTGITVKCGDTICIFEFIAYKYIGETEKVEEPETITLADLMEQQSNNNPPVFIGHLQSMSNDQPSETDHYTSLIISSPLTHPLVPGSYTFCGTQHPQLQRQNIPPPQSQQQNTLDFSPQARELERKQKSALSSKASSRSVSVQSPNNDQPVESSSSGLHDRNRQQYTQESSAKQGDRQTTDNGTTEASNLPQPSASTEPNTVGPQQRTGTVGLLSSPPSHGSSEQKVAVSATDVV